MSDRLLWSEVKKQYPNQWVGYSDPEYNTNNTLHAVTLIYTGLSRSQLAHRQINEDGVYGRFTTPEQEPDLMQVGVVS